MADQNEDLKKCKIKAFCSGGIPGFDIILNILQETTSDEEARSSANFNKSVKLIGSLKACNKLCIEFTQMYPLWKEERLKCIESINAIAEKINNCHRNANVAQLPAAGLGILSGALVITGLALTPVTFGASLGLTIAGTAVGVASAGAGGGASVTDMVITKRKVKEAHECFEEHKKNTAKLIELISTIVQMTDEIEQLSNKDTIHYLEAIVSRSDGALAKAATIGMVSNVKSVFYLINSIPDAVAGLKHLCMIVTSSPILQNILAIAPAQVGSAVAGIGAQGAGITATLGGQTLVAFSYIGGAVGIAVSSGVAAYTVYDMVKNESKTDAANKLRTLCEQLEKEHEEIEKFYEALMYTVEEKNDTKLHDVQDKL